MTNKNIQSFIKNEEAFSHKKDKGIILLCNNSSSENHLFLEGNEHFALFWESFTTPWNNLQFENSLPKEIFNLLIENKLIIPSEKAGSSPLKLQYSEMQLKLFSAPQQEPLFDLQAYAGSGFSDPSDY